MQPAKLWRPLPQDSTQEGDQPQGTVQCLLCNHFCRIVPGDHGTCGVRENVDGALFTHTADKIAALNLDPVEKKPLYHFQPGSLTFSYGTMGCNLSCEFCQNYTLSQPPRHNEPVTGRHISPQDMVREAIAVGAKSVAATYSEPTIFFELMHATAIEAKKQGLASIIVSNGFMSPDCLTEMIPVIDAANIDLKSFRDTFYRTYCGARLAPVLKNLVRLKQEKVWLEVTTLVIPGLNDSYEELADIAIFIHDELGHDTPWHISRFHPGYHMTNLPPTPEDTLERAWQLGREAGLDYVYVGNAPGHMGNNTFCPSCCRMTIARRGFSITRADPDGVCKGCGEPMAGVGLEDLGQ